MTDRASGQPRSIYFEIDGARMYGEWRREPAPSRPDLVFLHDGLGSTAVWRQFPESVADILGLGVFVYDRWGYGKSDRRDAFPADFMADGAARLPKVLDAAGIEDCILIGHSDGASIALLHAADRSPRVRATVSLAAHVQHDAHAVAKLHEFEPLLGANEAPGWLVRLQGERGPHLLRCWVETWLATFAGNWTITDSLRRIDVPLLAIQGSEDSFTGRAQIDAITAEVSHAETHILPGLNHAPHLEDTQTVAGLVTEFITRHVLR